MEPREIRRSPLSALRSLHKQAYLGTHPLTNRRLKWLMLHALELPLQDNPINAGSIHTKSESAPRFRSHINPQNDFLAREFSLTENLFPFSISLNDLQPISVSLLIPVNNQARITISEYQQACAASRPKISDIQQCRCRK
ncbi:hypothetical protein D3C77_469790 [compost metagenome]